MPGRKVVIFEPRIGVVTYDRAAPTESIPPEWISHFIIYNIKNGFSLEKTILFNRDEKCVSACFFQIEGSRYLVFGCSSGLEYRPKLEGRHHCLKLYRLNSANRAFELMANDPLPRYSTASNLVDPDYGVLCGGDKFGNLIVSKIS
ncbi:unnamed protein product [Sphagnum balticum]